MSTVVRFAGPAPAAARPSGPARIAWTVAAILILIPAAWLAEFNPATLMGEASLRATAASGDLLSACPGSGFSRACCPRCMEDRGHRYGRYHAAVLIAIPFALIANRQLSVSALATMSECVSAAPRCAPAFAGY